MKRKIVSLCMLFMLGWYAQAQRIEGVVVSAKDSSVVEFAPVALLSLPDSAIKAGIQTEVGGSFVFDNVKPGKYYIKVTYVGFSPNGKEITVAKDVKVIKLDTIRMAEFSKELNEVVVTGERIKGKELVDRTIFTIPSTVAKASANGYDVLKKIPSVQVDFQNNITLNGNSNFLIQVDGKQRDKEFLAKILPTDIETIEIINNPSGKYEGTIDGIINVTLKKEARYGMNGNIDLNLRPAKKPSFFGSGSLDYSTGKANYYISAFSFNQGLNVKSTNYTKYSDNKVTDIRGSGDMDIMNTSVNTGVDYYINDKNNLSLNLNYKPIKQDINSTNINLTQIDTTISKTKLRSNEGNASLFYKRQFTKPIQEFTSETNVYLFNSDNLNYFSKNKNNVEIDSRNDSTITNRYYISSKADYVHPIGFSSRIEVGYQFYYQSIAYSQYVKSKLDSNYDYGEFRNSAYAGLTYNLDKFGFQTNLRVERSDVNLEKKSNNNYYSWLPSGNLQYKINSTQNLKITYNRRINRPSTGDLNEYPIIGYDNTISQGNIKLKPEYRNKMQLTYTLNFGSNYFSPNIYYDAIDHKIDRVITYDENSGKKTSIPYNILNGNEKGVGISAMLWFFNINARYYKIHYNSFQLFGSEPINATDFETYSINSYAFAPIPGKINAFAFVGYNGPSKTAFTKTESLPFYGFGARKELGNHSFGFFYLLPGQTYVTFSKTVTTKKEYSSDVRQKFDVSYYIQFSYSYKFHQGRSVKKMDKKAEIESDSKAGGIGQ